MKLFNQLKGLFKRKDKIKKKDVIKDQKVKEVLEKVVQKKVIKKRNKIRFRDDYNLSELTRRKINKRRKKKKMEKASRKRNR